MQRSPVDKPPFTLGDIKKAIPPHCFHPSVIKSFSYLVHDLAIAVGLLYFALVCIPALPSILCFVAWPLYWAGRAAYSPVCGSLGMSVATTPSRTTCSLTTCGPSAALGAS
ncbi:hypothetical protein E2562_025887 [Oryza meyeriana var. granulata]|uniref:Fatty acid desaturase N-terminal domain-containing protein n=1 Tax=Oryza meyeriana var. granulata TaxID=110450 RepID=A0A6G1D7Y1_9ORYZ|nr:hypothetical protein E2562_025887 [Oryza meyeriana var. granulata]